MARRAAAHQDVDGFPYVEVAGGEVHCYEVDIEIQEFNGCHAPVVCSLKGYCFAYPGAWPTGQNNRPRQHMALALKLMGV